MRLHNQDDYASVFKNGIRFNSADFVIICRQKKNGPTRLGIIASRKVGGAVLRNYLKRVFRNIFRIEYTFLKQNCDIVLIIKSRAIHKNYCQLKNEFIEVCNRL